MINREDGFSLVELMITMVVFVFVIAAASQVFTGLLTQFKQQSKIAETNIEGIVGLELLRLDIEHAGYGLPWFFQNSINYGEAASAPASSYNDSPGNPPRAIVSGNDVTFSSPNNIFNGSDYLVIKSTVVARSDTAQRWSYIVTGNNPRTWTADDLQNGDRVIVIRPKVSETRLRELVMNGATFFTTYSATAFPAQFSPTEPSESYLIYGVASSDITSLRMPFNRADYYIWRGSTNPATDEVPDRCAPNTGILRKAVVNHSGGTFQGGILPLLDCVADMQVIYRLDMDNDGDVGTSADADGSNVSSSEGASATTVQQTMDDAALLRERLKEVRIYILAHEGQRDTNYTYPTNPITVGEFGLGRSFNFVTAGITDWQNYRWKIYTMIVKPNNLR